LAGICTYSLESIYIKIRHGSLQPFTILLMLLLLLLLLLLPLLLFLLQWVGYLTWRRQLEMLAGVAAGMAHLHRWGQLRGDLRTSCVFVMPDGEVSSRMIQLLLFCPAAYVCTVSSLPRSQQLQLVSQSSALCLRRTLQLQVLWFWRTCTDGGSCEETCAHHASLSCQMAR
jgi:hypothetical protein